MNFQPTVLTTLALLVVAAVVTWRLLDTKALLARDGPRWGKPHRLWWVPLALVVAYLASPVVREQESFGDLEAQRNSGAAAFEEGELPAMQEARRPGSGFDEWHETELEANQAQSREIEQQIEQQIEETQR